MWLREEWLASFMSGNYCFHPSIRIANGEDLFSISSVVYLGFAEHR